MAARPRPAPSPPCWEAFAAVDWCVSAGYGVATSGGKVAVSRALGPLGTGCTDAFRGGGPRRKEPRETRSTQERLGPGARGAREERVRRHLRCGPARAPRAVSCAEGWGVSGAGRLLRLLGSWAGRSQCRLLSSSCGPQTQGDPRARPGASASNSGGRGRAWGLRAVALP